MNSRHEKVWDLESIRELRSKGARERTGRFFADGIRFVSEALATGARMDALVAAPSLIPGGSEHRIVRQARVRGTPVLEVSAVEYCALSLNAEPQGLGVVAWQKWERLDRVRPGRELCMIAIETVQSPGNLGTVIRTCEAAGAGGLILLNGGADPYDPGCVRGSMGAIFSQRMIRASLPQLLAWKRMHNAVLVGASPHTTRNYRAMPRRRRIVLLLGSERKGLTPEQEDACDLLVRIPMVGRVDSLNLGVASGILLYELFNRRQAGLKVEG